MIIAEQIVGQRVWTAALILLSVPLLAQEQAQSNSPANRPIQPLNTEVRHVGTAEVQRVVKGGFFPSRQPAVYWHDSHWNLDLMIPTSEGGSFSLGIRSSEGKYRVVVLPESYAQVDSVSLASGDKGIIVGECGGTCNAFAIIDLSKSQLIDDISVENLFISPSQRFIIYDNAFTPHSDDNENLYHLYDTQKSPRENVCGYRVNDLKHESLDDTLRGFQVYPQRLGQILCTDSENDETNDDNIGTNFTWSDDSSRIIFADVKSGVMSLILVTMPVGTNDLPKTSVYALTGANDVCAGATDAAGETVCDYHIIQSLGWDGGEIKGVFHHQFGIPLDLTLTIPTSSFVPIGK
jgi:hypothetical protein